MKQYITFLLSVLIITASLSFVIAQTDFENIRDAQVAIRHARLEMIGERFDAIMEGSINYIEDIEGETSELINFRDEFNEEREKLQDLDTHIELNDQLLVTRNILQDFKQEYDSQFRDNDGKGLIALVSIGEATQNRKDQIDSTVDNFWEVREEQVAIVFDIHFENLEGYVEWFRNRDYDTSELDEKLEEIQDKRAELLDAIQDRDELQIAVVHSETRVLLREMREIAQDLRN